MKGSSPEAAVLADIALVLLLGVALTPLRHRLRQPAVVAEIAAGLLLGPSVLGLLPGHLPDVLFPDEVRAHLSAIAQVGIALFLFAAGWELDFRSLPGRGRSVLGVAAASLMLPFALAMVLAGILLAVRPDLTGSPLLFAPFLGIVLSVGALSVLIRIVDENRLQAAPAGATATACGAVSEVVAWCAMAALLTAAQGPSSGSLLVTLAGVAAYALVMLLAVRPALRALFGRPGARPMLLVLVVSSGVFLSAWCTTWLGVHAVIGAFAFGLVMPRDLAPELRGAVEEPVRHTGALLIPVFFALAGLTVDVTRLGPRGLLALAGFLAVAWGGRFAGAALSARLLLRMPRREAAVLGVLVNTKGLSEVIMLSLGREAGLIDDRLFTVLLLTALSATVLVNPLVRLLTERGSSEAPTVTVPAQQPALREPSHEQQA
ncbi:cation:proton antiporter [Streptomyces sp. AV19]|uniref:cation:proton antiporter domain-containing protein n=1 Tax=Streptomyces sp. AV19 TaxID=2793068 RepID=UPI0018FEBEAE|nr:cation:proton antiporter [Streptomyces sp. AV19]MBH1937751.1 cation:proton antiporter [Streptomyces sp. AV19]MDG4536420.1 cation:proton antiporter [Streptomyces sp. AV19]